MSVVALSGLFARLMKDTRGNALILMGASLIPLVAAIGCGMDYARASMARSKLQQAVDAAALAGRRAMTADNIETAKPDAVAYLAFNFPAGIYGTTPMASAVTKPDIGEVQVSATSTVPMTMMKIFGIAALPIKAVGNATQNFENIDIMLVLDTTGSMDEEISSGSGKQKIKKLESLKQAVAALYAQLAPAQEQLKRQNLRMRYGILPYSTTVNVGLLEQMKFGPSYLQTAAVTYYHWHATKSGKSTVWSFGQQNYDLSGYVNGTALGNVNGNGDFSSEKWAGCIEERKTDSGILAGDSRGAAPATAYDLDIDMIPTAADKNTQWKPYVYDVANPSSKSSDGVGPNTYCPTSALPLQEMTQAELTAQLNKLVSRGNTYHDIGIIWGVRMISNAGIFGSKNPDTYGQQKVRRYIIFMTDGEMNAPIDDVCTRNCAEHQGHSSTYSSYGIEAYDKRIGAKGSDPKKDSDDRHATRFMMACNAAKAKGISIWTIAFGTTANTNLSGCASNADQYSYASDSTALIDKFTQIGKQIGPLRISH
jgi:Flp pilus assembly protein TadG